MRFLTSSPTIAEVLESALSFRAILWQSILMHLAHLRLRDFRNYARLDVDFAPGFNLLLGDNAQGKTNILEAIYLIATLRSFRGVGGAQMVRHAQKGYFVGGKVVGQGEHETKMYWSSRERSLNLDGRPVRKLTDYLGVLRTVVFCTEDLQLIKGAASARRRFLDLLLSQTYPAYLPLRQRRPKTHAGHGAQDGASGTSHLHTRSAAGAAD